MLTPQQAALIRRAVTQLVKAERAQQRHALSHRSYEFYEVHEDALAKARAKVRTLLRELTTSPTSKGTFT